MKMKAWFDQNKNWMIIILMVMVIGILALVLYQPFVSLLSDSQSFRLWLNQYGLLAYFIFGLINMAQVILVFLPGEIVEVLAGYCFGSINGCLVCMIASGIASSIIFLLMRHFHIDLIKLFFKKDKTDKFSFLTNTKNMTMVLFIIFLIPGTPKDLLTYLMPLTSIKFTSFLGITTLARIPSIITSTMVGDALFNQDFMISLIVYGITAILSGLGLYVYNRYIGAKEVKA